MTLQTSLIAIKSPKEDKGSEFRAEIYAEATGVKSYSFTSYIRLICSDNCLSIATPAGLLCLNDTATILFNVCDAAYYLFYACP